MLNKNRTTPLTVLFATEIQADVDLTLNELRNAGYTPAWHCVQTREGFFQHITSELDLIIADPAKIQLKRNEVFKVLSAQDRDIPVIIITSEDEELALDWLKSGAADYHITDRLLRLGQSVNKVLREREDREERKTNLENLRTSEERYRGVVESAVVGVSIADTQERITYANPAFADMIGYMPDDLLAMSLDQIVHPSDFTRILEETDRRRNGLTSQYEINMIRSDGEVLSVIISASPLTSSSGEYIGSHAIITNITDRVNMENDLITSEEKLRLMIDKSPLGFSMTDLDGHMMDVNPAFCLMLGYTKTELVSKHFDQYTHPDDIEGNRALYQRLVEGEIDNFEIKKRFIHKNGSTIHVLIRSQLVWNFDGKPIFEYAIIEDITERLLADERNQKLQLMLSTISAVNHLLLENIEPGSLIKKACQILTNNRKYDHAWIVLFDKKGEFLESAEEGLGEVFEPLRSSLRDGLDPYCGIKSLSQMGLVCVKDPIEECGNCPLASSASDQIALTIPIKFEERVLGLISVSLPDFQFDLDQEKDLLCEIGGDIGLALHNIEIDHKNKERDAQLRLQSHALESAANAIVITDANGFIQWVNPAFQDLTGFCHQDTIGKTPRILKSGNHDEGFYQNFWNTISSGAVWHGELINKRKNGDLYTEEMTVAPVLNPDQGISNYIAIKQDVSERKRAEDEIKQQTEDLVLINKINDAANRGMDFELILELLTLQAKQIFNCIGATVYLVNKDRQALEMQTPPEHIDAYQRIVKLVKVDIPSIRLPIHEHSLTDQFLTADGPLLINDHEIIQQWMLEFTNAIGLPEKARTASRNMMPQISKLLNVNSMITIPMVSAGETIGLMDFTRSEPFTEEDTQRVARIVGQVTLAITKLHSDYEKQHSRKLLEAISQAAPEVQRAGTIDEIFGVIGEHLAKLNYNVTVFLLNETRSELSVAFHNLSGLAKKIEKLTGLSDLNYSFPLKSGGFFDKIIQGGDTSFSQLEVDPISEAIPMIAKPLIRKILDLFGWQQSIIAPLAVGSDVTGLISISGEDLHEFDKPAVTTIANQAAVAIEKTRLYNETQDLAKFNTGIVQNMLEGIVIENAEGCFDFVNPAGEKLLGYSIAELIGMHWTHLVPQESHSVIREANTRRRKGESDRYETDLVHKDGHLITALVSSSPIYDRDHNFQGSLVVFTDITERKIAEEAIKQNVKRLDALHVIDQAIMGSFDLDLSLNIILEQILIQLDVDAVSVLSYRADLQTLEYTNGRGFQTDALRHTNLRLGEGFAGSVALQREHVFIPDLNQDEGKFHKSHLFEAERFLAYYGVPLIAKGKLVGVLELFNRRAIEPKNDWVTYLKLMAGQMAIAIDNSVLFNELQSTNVDLTLAYDATIEGWAHALELKDLETEGHSRRVVDMTMDLARKMGVYGDKLAHIRRGALLHDIGKMGIPDSILQKPGKLNDEEWRVMKQHPVYAYDWLSRIKYLKPALKIPYAHHERWDGTGYPRGLQGDQIPLEARIFAIVDVWDALNSDRPYRKAWPREKVLEHIETQAGSHFDPDIVDLFLATLLQEKK